MSKKLIPILFLLVLLCLAFTSCKDKHQHNYVETTYPSTCSENGYTQKLCTDCGDELLYDFKPRAGHSGEWKVTKDPTCQSVGTEERLCLTCNKIYETRSIAKLGHISGEWKVTKAPTCKETGTEKLFCNTCGIDLESRTLDMLNEHDLATVVTPPTTTSEGYTTYNCKLCDFSKKDNFVPKLEIPSVDTPNVDTPDVDTPEDETPDIEEPTGLTIGQIYDLMHKATVRVDIYDKNNIRVGAGSGFFISNDGKIATNYHVIRGAYSVKVTTYFNTTTYTVSTVLGYNKSQDVAIIQVDAQNTSYLEISNDAINVGDAVYTLGSPKVVDDIFTSGIISNVALKIDGKDCIGITAPISSGNSGGPLVNSKGQVIGINTMKIDKAENFNLSIKAKQITSLNTSSPCTTQELYTKTLSENAYQILCISLLQGSKGSKVGDDYVVYSTLPETEEGAGFDTYYYCNIDTGAIKIKIHIVKNQKRLYTFELDMTGIGDRYRVGLFDFDLGQYGMEAFVNAKNPFSSYETDFENLFDIISFRYVEGDNVPPENIKQIFFQMYQYMLNGLNTFLEKSNTGLSLSHFNFKFQLNTL